VREQRAVSGPVDVLLPSVDLLTAASVARRAGYSVTLRDYAVAECNLDGLAAEIGAAHDPLVLALVTLATIRGDCDFLAELRSRLRSLRIVLLTAIEHSPILIRALKGSQADFALLPEGIGSLPEVLDNVDTKNTSWLDKDGTIRRGKREPLADLDKLPAPDWSLMSDKGYAYTLKNFPRTDFAPLRTALGCPFSCGYYCPYPLTQGTKVRVHSLPWVVDRIVEIANMGFAGIVFQDPVFTVDRRRTSSLCNRLVQLDLGLKWACETRIDRLDEELIMLMARAGCVGIEVGVESGNREVMQRQGKPGLTPEKVVEFRTSAARYGIEASFLFIIGLPMETKSSIVDTFRLIEASGIDPEQVNFSVITPYPGTALYADAIERGWISSDWDEFSGFQPVMRTDNLSIDDLIAVQNFAEEFVTAMGVRRRGEGVASGIALERFYATLSDWAGKPLAG
jgi:radical SAM superfamily enzyme YgiQ (UPF0313 family)